MSPEATRAVNFLASLPSGNTTVTKKDCAAILLETGGSLLACGSLYNIDAKHLGAGVYKLELKLANP